MRVSMDGLRKNLARDYNDVVDLLKDVDAIDDNMELRRIMDELSGRISELRGTIGMSLCIYDEKEPDFHDLSDEIKLEELREEDEDCE